MKCFTARSNPDRFRIPIGIYRILPTTDTVVELQHVRVLVTSTGGRFCSALFQPASNRDFARYIFLPRYPRHLANTQGSYLTTFLHPTGRRISSQVSRYLSQVTRSRDVWSDAYRNAKFARPPGPFFWQSARDLENALVSCFRVNRNLRLGGRTAQEEKSILKLRVKEVLYTDLRPCVSLVFGRFLLIAFNEEIHCHDLNLNVFNSKSGANIIHRSKGGTLRSFHCVSAFDTEGHPFACVVLNEATGLTSKM